MEGTQGTPLVGVTDYKEWKKGSVFHISFHIDGRYFMRSCHINFIEAFRDQVHKTVAEYWKKKEAIIKHNELQDKLEEAERNKKETT